MSKSLQTELTAEPRKGGKDASKNPATEKFAAMVVLPAGQETRSKQRSWRWALWVGLAVSGSIAAWLYYAQPWQRSSAEMAVEILAPAPITRVLAVNGRIAALRYVAVKSTIAGTLVATLAEEGDVVEQGAVLARLDDTSQQAVVRQAVAALDQGLVARSQARDLLARADALKGNVSRVALENAQRAVEQSEQEIDRLRALVDQMQFQLTKFNILAPIAGTILTRGVEPGQVVGVTTPLFTLADLGELVVETDVDESYATQIKQGMPALLQLTGDSRTLDGTVSFVAPVIDESTGGLAVKIAFNEPQHVPVGLTVTANITVDQRDAAISVPRSAISRAASTTAVFVLVDGKARLTPVSVIDWPAERLIVTEGLEAGDILIVDGSDLADGQAVIASGE